MLQHFGMLEREPYVGELIATISDPVLNSTWYRRVAISDTRGRKDSAQGSGRGKQDNQLQCTLCILYILLWVELEADYRMRRRSIAYVSVSVIIKMSDSNISCLVSPGIETNPPIQVAHHA